MKRPVFRSSFVIALYFGYYVALSWRNLTKKTEDFHFLRVVSHSFTPDPKNTKNSIARDRFLVSTYSVNLKVRFALSLQLQGTEKENFYAMVFIQLDNVVLYSLVVSKSAL
jgi:hypothetical protein